MHWADNNNRRFVELLWVDRKDQMVSHSLHGTATDRSKKHAVTCSLVQSHGKGVSASEMWGRADVTASRKEDTFYAVTDGRYIFQANCDEDLGHF